jgi:hypothetical protein
MRVMAGAAGMDAMDRMGLLVAQLAIRLGAISG